MPRKAKTVAKKPKKEVKQKQKQKQSQVVNVNITNPVKQAKRKRKTGNSTAPRLGGLPQSTNVVVHNNLSELSNLLANHLPQQQQAKEQTKIQAQVQSVTNPVIVHDTLQKPGVFRLSKPKMSQLQQLTRPINVTPKPVENVPEIFHDPLQYPAYEPVAPNNNRVINLLQGASEPQIAPGRGRKLGSKNKKTLERERIEREVAERQSQEFLP